MKKVISFIIAVMMLVQMFTFTVSAASAPSKVYWSKDFPGEIRFTIVEGVTDYIIKLYRNNVEIADGTHSYEDWKQAEGMHHYLDLICNYGSGTYRAEVGPNDGSDNFTSSDNYVYTRPSKTLPKATNVKYNQNKQVITWNSVSGAYAYDVCFCYSIDGGESFNTQISYWVDTEDDCYFDFWGGAESELEYIEEEYQWVADEEGVDVDDLLRAIQIVAYPQDLNDANVSYSDYLTFDGTSIPSDDPNKPSGGGVSGGGCVVEELEWGSEPGVITFMPTVEGLETCLINLYKDGELVDYIWHEFADYELTFGVELFAFRETVAELGNGEYQFSITMADENYEFWDGEEIFSDIYVHKVLTQVDRSSITNGKYKDAAKLAYDLGFMKNVYDNPSANITKGEFCEIVVKMLGAEDVAKTLNDRISHYEDVETGTDLNGYVKYVENKSLLNTAGSSFGVATEIPYIHILKVFVSMLGYEPIAQQQGGYPTGYMYVAAQNNITKGLSIGQDSSVTKEQMALLVFNAMKSKTMKVESYTGNVPVYKQSEESLLFELGYATIDGIGYADGTNLTIDNGTLKDIDNLKGKDVTNLELENCDYDALALNGKKTTYYVIDGKAMCALPKFGGSVVINNGDAETSNRNVTLTIKADGYTKYKLEGSSTYFPITSTLSYRLAETDGTQTVRITLANDDETQTLNVSDSIILNNKHKITYKANGRVFRTVEVGCGKSVPAMTEIPSQTGYRFDGWDTQIPSVMPDYDIVVNAKMTPITTVTGKVTVKGIPVEGAKVWIGEYYYAQTDANGEFSFDMERGHQTATIKYNNMSKAVFCEFKDAILELGEIALEAESTEINVAEQSITSVSGAEKLFDEEDKEYVKTEGNVVAVKVDVKSADENTNIAEKEEETSYKVETLVDIDITKVKSGAETSETEITETNELLEFKFVIPAESRGKASYVILREHNEEVDMLTTVPNADGEYIVINQDVIVVYAKKFSTYALAAKEVVSATKTDNGVSLEINLNEQVVEDGALMIVKAYNKRGVQVATKTILVETSAYSGTIELVCKDATGYKLMFWSGFEKINPYYAVIDGSL